MTGTLFLHYIFFFNDTATTEIYTLSLPRRSSDLDAGRRNKSVLSLVGISEGFSTTKGVTWQNGHCAERDWAARARSEEHTSELQSRQYLVCRLLLEKKKQKRSLLCILTSLSDYLC